MKKLFLVSIAALVPAFAAAHTSILPHEHPHAISMLPDIALLLMAAVIVGAGAVVIAILKRAQR